MTKIYSTVFQVNQIGTVTESIQAALDSKAAGWGVMVSHRSGETEDNFIADLAVGLASGQVGTITIRNLNCGTKILRTLIR